MIPSFAASLIFKKEHSMKKTKTEMIHERDMKISELRMQIHELNKGSKEQHKAIDAILYEVLKKYGDEAMSITIGVPDTKTVPKISAEKKDDTYVIRVASEQ